MAGRGLTPIASVAMSRPRHGLPGAGRFLRELGFAAVTFSYPRKAPLGSSSLVWSEDSDLVDLSAAELLAAFDAVDEVREIIPVHNPRASIADMRRRLRGEAERFHCLAGYKYFYLDWNYDLWRCEDWNAPLCPVWEFEPGKTIRDGCQACTTDCYRDASVMLHFAVAPGRRLRPHVRRPPDRRRRRAGRPAQRRLAGRRHRPRQPLGAARRRGLTPLSAGRGRA
jgi:hypothetical protein